MNYAQVKAIENANKMRWLAVNSMLSDECGIYIMMRSEDGIKYAYVGQAKHILSRLAQHLSGYDMYIDLSLKKHGLYNEITNPTGWTVKAIPCKENELNYWERYCIREYANNGFQLRNKTLGGQDKGKVGIDSNKPSKGYRDGLAQGYKNAQRYISQLFEKNLVFGINGEPNKNKIRAMDKFMEFIQLERIEKE